MQGRPATWGTLWPHLGQTHCPPGPAANGPPILPCPRPPPPGGPVPSPLGMSHLPSVRLLCRKPPTSQTIDVRDRRPGRSRDHGPGQILGRTTQTLAAEMAHTLSGSRREPSFRHRAQERSQTEPGRDRMLCLAWGSCSQGPQTLRSIQRPDRSWAQIQEVLFHRLLAFPSPPFLYWTSD